MAKDTHSARSVLGGAGLLLHTGAGWAPEAVEVIVPGGVGLGVKLAEADAAGSALRGGDGMAASLEGGRLVAILPASSVCSERSLFVLVRVCDPAGRWEGLLVSGEDGAGKRRFAISGAAGAVVFELHMDWSDAPLRLEAPLTTIGAAGWHDVAARYAGHVVELFVDGVLVDEDWPIGKLPSSGAGKVVVGGGFRGLVDHVAVWDRALSDAEIEALSGGAAAAASRGWSIDPPESGVVQYARAPGGGFVGDCMPFFHDGTYHFYYLFDRRNHRSKLGLGAHQWAHASSRDLVHWTHHPLAVGITEEREGSICTGSMFFHDGTWYAFYATRMPDRSEHLSLATGKDGSHFSKTEPNPFASPKPPYKPGPFRDPTVFRDEKTGLFHMLVTAELERADVARRGGCLAHLVSRDLLIWEQKEPFLVTGYGDQPECSELFFWRGWYYLVFSHFGLAHYRMARDPLGPWIKPRVDTFDGPRARVMKTAAFTGDRRIGAFFLSEPVGYAGRAVFRELVQLPGGELGTSWPAEMVPSAEEPVRPAFQPLGPGASGDAGRIRIQADQGYAAAALVGVPGDLLVTFRVLPSPGTYLFEVGVRGSGSFAGGHVLSFEPGRRRVGWRDVVRHTLEEGELSALCEVDGMDKPFTVEIVAKEEVYDVCIDGKRTMINRSTSAAGDRLFFGCHCGEVTFESIDVRPLWHPAVRGRS